MKYTCIGYQICSFKGSDGSTVEGVNLSCLTDDPNYVGKKAEKFFVTKRLLATKVPDKVPFDVILEYNKRGKIGFAEIVRS